MLRWLSRVARSLDSRKGLLITWLVFSLAVAASTVGLDNMKGRGVWEARGLVGMLIAALCVLVLLYQCSCYLAREKVRKREAQK